MIFAIAQSALAFHSKVVVQYHSFAASTETAAPTPIAKNKIRRRSIKRRHAQTFRPGRLARLNIHPPISAMRRRRVNLDNSPSP